MIINNYYNKYVKVYFNLHKNLFSIKYRNKVIGYSEYVELDNVKFTVQNSGRNKVIETNQKNVHAYVCGYLICSLNSIPNIDLTKYNKVTYNPYVSDSFYYIENKMPIKNTNNCILINSNVKIYVV
jgi:hypothetical protein